MNQIIPFTYEGNNVRTLTTEDGELRFVLADLAAVLDITNVTQLRSRLSDDLCQTYPVPDRRGQVQQTWTVKDMGPNKFCRWLLDNNFAFRNGQGKIIPMQDAVNRGILTH